ncbi:hypothetical protein [Empedobacter sp. UBA7248]|uniref:hypothetical protein n=1 Tax=Empedobacter sp. UBA7248 TaxID=1946448 RepID=UPI0025B81E89|nr:hypothetical protein [Empedobacter sp. UBA7248]
MSIDKKILIKQIFNEQYTLVVEMEARLIDSYMTSCTKLRYDFTIINFDENSIECRLVLLDIYLEKSNNDLIREVAQLTAAFNRMFNELHLKLSQKGDVIEVINIDLIVSKWEETKLEMKSVVANNEELKKLIAINDALFTNKEKLRTAIQGNEFFSVYFGHIYNVDLPNRKKVFGTNIFNTANMEWDVESESNIKLPSENLETLVILTKAKPEIPLSLGTFNAAYNQFKDKINIDPVKIKIFQEEERSIDYRTGRLKKASVKKVEDVVSEKLYNKFTYTMTSDSEKKKNNLEKLEPAHKSEIYTDENGKEYTHEEWIEHKKKFWGTGSIE